MLNALLKRYNHYRKEKYFQSPLFHAQKQYAFVGFGVHSMTSFYPILRHFNIPLKYICTKNSDWKSRLSPLFPGCSFVHDLQPIIADEAIAGVFVCADPDAHFGILTRLLGSGKAVFVEKPPCRTLAELGQLQSINPAAICKVGLQRRYWPGNRPIAKKCRNAASYIYQFQTGAYPNNDPLTGLFIHPLDYAHFLFGKSQMLSSSRQEGRNGITLQLHLRHTGGQTGLLHLSTSYTWNPPLESLTIHTPSECLLIQYPASVHGKRIPLTVMNLPVERLTGRRATTTEYFSGAPTLLPTMETNSLYVQGFLPEIEQFVTLVENPGATEPGETNDLPSLADTYTLMEKLAQPATSL